MLHIKSVNKYFVPLMVKHNKKTTLYGLNTQANLNTLSAMHVHILTVRTKLQGHAHNRYLRFSEQCF